MLQSCLTLYDSMHYSLRGSSVHGILQARILEWVANPGTEPTSPMSPTLAGGFFTTRTTWEDHKAIYDNSFSIGIFILILWSKILQF